MRISATAIAADSPAAAEKLMACLHDLSELLSENPRRGMAPPDIAADLRHFPVGDYLVLYRNLGDRVEIVRYVHGCLRLQDLV
nr:type II toxin-antitoxin system RelE/ParE family toxin [Methylocystis hirsuta]